MLDFILALGVLLLDPFLKDQQIILASLQCTYGYNIIRRVSVGIVFCFTAAMEPL